MPAGTNAYTVTGKWTVGAAPTDVAALKCGSKPIRIVHIYVAASQTAGTAAIVDVVPTADPLPTQQEPSRPRRQPSTARSRQHQTPSSISTPRRPPDSAPLRESSARSRFPSALERPPGSWRRSSTPTRSMDYFSSLGNSLR